ncbi:MAG: hypothetical protein AAB373_01150 [Patescibacteria group bacterium]
MPETDFLSESVEPINPQQVIYLLRNKGPNDPEARSLLEAWILQYEEQVVESADPATASVLLNVYRARLYLAADHHECARENFEEARQQSYQFGLDELSQRIEDEMNRAGL